MKPTELDEVEDGKWREHVSGVIDRVELQLHKNGIPEQRSPYCASSKSPTTAADQFGQFNERERNYLKATERGDLSLVKQLVANASELKLNINCVDPLGRGALQIAIENEQIEVLEFLLTVPQLNLKECLLHAINADNIQAVESVLKAEDNRKGHAAFPKLVQRFQSTSFTADISSVILAAHRDNYMVLKMLLDRGERIAKPHEMSCACSDCVEARRADGLQHSRLRINTYRALTSPSFILLTSHDPILTAFKMSMELRKLGQMENEFQNEYKEMSERAELFATKLLEQTRSTSELRTILDCETESSTMHVLENNSEDNQWQSDHSCLPRLKLAIECGQKKFVAHPNCQQLLATMWYDGLPGFRQKSLFTQACMTLTLCTLFPVLTIVYMLAPNSSVGGLIKMPFIKFLCHSSSYITFLSLLLLTAVRIESILTNTVDERMNDRSPLPSLSEMAVMIYIAGFLWQEIKKVYRDGLRSYITDMWHLVDFVMISIYISTIAMRSVACFRVWAYSEPRFVSRGHWDSFDPILISECLFAVANIMSILRVINIFTVSPQLGPLQISLGRMLYDIIKFFCIYLLVIVAFAFGLNQLFWFYANNRARNCKDVQFTLEEGQKDVYEYCITRGTYFTNLFEIVQSLYWSTYGLIELTSFNLEYPHTFTEFVGKLMFGTYSYIAFIVLLNMLIAMMNNSYEQIVQQVDVEWKFARAKLWISYFAEGYTVTIPFNLIPSYKSFLFLYQKLKERFTRCCEPSEKGTHWDSVKHRIQSIHDREAKYTAVMQQLTKRYLTEKLRTTATDANTLNELKGDISALRAELLDILRTNGMKLPNQQSNDKIQCRKRDESQKKVDCAETGRLTNQDRPLEDFQSGSKTPPQFIDSNMERRDNLAFSGDGAFV